MESACTWEYRTLIDELVQGMEKAKQLHFHLCSTPQSPSEAEEMLMQRILSSYEKALLMLNWKAPVEQSRAPEPVAVESSISVDGSVSLKTAGRRSKSKGPMTIPRCSRSRTKGSTCATSRLMQFRRQHHSSLFTSPATSETNYFSPAPQHMSTFGGSHSYQHSESDIAEIVSAHTSTTNSPIGTMDFPADPLDLDPNLPFSISAFFR